MNDRAPGALGGSYQDPLHSSARIRFRRAIALAVMTIVLPGSAQLVWGNRAVGRIVVRVWIGLIGLAALLALTTFFWRSAVFALLTNSVILWLGRWSLVVIALVWVVLLYDAWRIARPLELKPRHRTIMASANMLMSLAIAAVLLFASHLISVQSGFIDTVFAAETTSEPTDGRYNVLLLGADSGADRQGMRPDSINVASIDAETGRIVLVGLPRNLANVPFSRDSVMGQQFPQGFNCDDCFLNGVNTWATDNAELFTSANPGIDATMDAVEEITGLELNYYALVNMEGFSSLIDAVGGVEINVQERTAIGAVGEPIQGYIEAGAQTLDGETALWYARSRVENDDWSRMGRQKCVIHAMVRQLSPQSVLMNATAIAESGSHMLETNIPRGDLNVFLDLALDSRSQPISTVSLVPPLIYTGNPDYGKVREVIENAIADAEGETLTQALVTSRLPVVTVAAETSEPREVNQSENLDTSC